MNWNSKTAIPGTMAGTSENLALLSRIWGPK